MTRFPLIIQSLLAHDVILWKPTSECHKSTCRIGGDSVLDEAGELLLVSVLILLHQVAHVLRHIDAHDVLAVDLSVELLALCVIPREALGAEGGK